MAPKCVANRQIRQQPSSQILRLQNADSTCRLQHRHEKSNKNLGRNEAEHKIGDQS